MRIVWRRDALASARRFMGDQSGMRAINQAVATLADDPEPPDAFVRGSYRRLRVGAYRVLYEVEDDVITIVRVDRASLSRETQPARSRPLQVPVMLPG